MKNLIHIGIAVKNIEEASRVFSALFKSQPIGEEIVESQKVKIRFFQIGNVSLELTEATDAGSPIAKFIEKRGEGVHHLAFEVDDIYNELERLKSEGFQLVDEKPRVGAGGHLIAFIHPKSTNGVLIEITQK